MKSLILAQGIGGAYDTLDTWIVGLFVVCEFDLVMKVLVGVTARFGGAFYADDDLTRSITL